jgi:excisionase family DNA binding protein
MNLAIGETLLTTGEAAKRLDLSPDSVRRLEREGALHAIKVGKGHRLFNQADVEKLRAKRTKNEGIK